MDSLLVTPPTVLAVSLDAAREKIRQTTNDLDDQLTLSIQGLVAEVENKVGQRFMEQVWRVTLDVFPPACAGEEPLIRLPHPALEVTLFSYVAPDGTSQSLAPSDFELVVEAYRSYVAPAAGKAWPESACQPRAVKIECKAGYGADPTDTPAVARQYILARLELEYCPPLKPVGQEYLDGLLNSLQVYG